MKRIPYKSTIRGPLLGEFSRGFKRLLIKRAAHNLPNAVVLWHPDGDGLRVQVEMHDIAERLEVGALDFSRIREPVGDASEFDLSDEFSVGLNASKLVLTVRDVTIESGVVLRGGRGNEIVLVAGVSPYTLAIKGPSLTEPFEPAYPLSEYSLEPIN